jgi:LuxR family maltose regulon positive regulatory protein
VAEIQMAQGQLRNAQATFDEALRMAAGRTAASPRGTADIHVGQAQVALERGDLELARQQLATARGLGEDRGLPPYAYRSRAVAAMLAEAEGDLAGALELVVEAQRVYLGDFSPNLRPLHAVAARLQIRLGNLDSVERWAHDHDVTASQELSYLREFEHVTLAEAMLARGSQLDAADGLLQRLLHAANAGGRDATVIEVLVLQALSARAVGDDGSALTLLDQATRLAEPEGQVRAFARHGALVAPLLESLAASPRGVAFARTLLAACHAAADATLPHGATTTPELAEAMSLIEPLSARELEVLQFLDTELDGPEIAQRLFVSLNTMRTHTKSIYTKFGVNNRRAAVRRGRELGLLTGR